MNIPPKYEDVVAQLEAERELHKLATETLGQFADENQKLHADLAALREELAKWQGIAGRRTSERTEFINERDDARADRDALQQRLTVAVQLLRDAQAAFNYNPEGSCYNPGISFVKPWSIKVIAALKPAAEGEGK